MGQGTASRRADAWARIEQEIADLLAADGLELVELQVSSGRHKVICASVDHRDAPGTITIDECAAASRRIGRYLEREDPFDGPYRLQVSSPGVDRPLARLEHARRAVGQAVKVTYRDADRKATVSGRLEAVEGERLRLLVGDREETVAWSAVQKANVVYNWEEA